VFQSPQTQPPQPDAGALLGSFAGSGERGHRAPVPQTQLPQPEAGAQFGYSKDLLNEGTVFQSPQTQLQNQLKKALEDSASDRSILRHSGICGVADEAVLIKVHEKSDSAFPHAPGPQQEIISE
jgi:hypothetical protein